MARQPSPHRSRRACPSALAVLAALTVMVVPGGTARAAEQLSLAQTVGQVFMVGAPATGAGAATISAIRDRHVGSVILTGRSTNGVGATAAVTSSLQAQATGGLGLLVATDQEGGLVQVLKGTGFSAIPTALSQGTLDPATLRASATAWGSQLRAAGVTVNLAPVLDTVPSAAAAATNPPIGQFDREYGYTPATVASHGVAFAQGMSDAGVVATAKHFPGLGRVTANTDTQSGVTDTVTTRNDPYLAPFTQAVHAGVPVLMVSTAYYSRIDPAHPAAFSSTVIQGMVRGDLGFRGVVVSDDLGTARQVAAWSPGSRALQFLQAGGDLVLTVDPTQLPAMYDAVLARAGTDAGFRARVQQAASRVLALKRARGLLPAAGYGNLDVVMTQNTGSGRTELHALDAGTNFGTFRLHTATPLGPVDLSDQQFLVADYDGDGIPDLWLVNTQGGSGHTEVHVLSGASHYQTWLLHAVTVLPHVSRADWTFGAADDNGDGRADLLAVNSQDVGSGHTAVFAWNGHNLQQALLAAATPLGHLSLTGTTFLFGDYDHDGRADLWYVPSQATGSGRTEVHVLSGADPTRWLLHAATPLPLVSLTRWSFGLADDNLDGTLDLYADDSADPGSGRTAVHVLGGPGFGTWIEHAATALGQVDLATTELIPG